MKLQRFAPDGALILDIDNRTIAEAQKERIETMRMFCRCQIEQPGIDTATQQNAALGIYPPERCDAIKSYIAACRDEYLRCKALILAATTNDEADAVTFTAPPVPEGL
jgi:hypothetical protein